MRFWDTLLALLIGLASWQVLVIVTDAPHFILPSPWRVHRPHIKAA